MAQMIVLTGIQFELPPALIKALEGLGCKPAFEIAVFAESRGQPVIFNETEVAQIEASVTGAQSAKVEFYVST